MDAKDYALPFYSQVLDFLAGAPSIQEIVNFQPSLEAQQRFSELLELNRQRPLTLSEQEELDHSIRMDRMLSLLKAKAHNRLEQRPA
ncbi:MAG: hypothetical protein HY327_06980 [Chloroflexi bacterium]|nr:hypothetical protein [Chloroflexota bacterium]